MTSSSSSGGADGVWFARFRGAGGLLPLPRRTCPTAERADRKVDSGAKVELASEWSSSALGRILLTVLYDTCSL